MALEPLLRKLFRAAVFAAFLLCFCLCVPAQDRSEFWPELDTYVSLSSWTRLFFITALSADQDSRNVQGEFGPNFDFYLRPFARPRLRDMDPSKSKLLTFRVGYRYLPTLRGEGATENRGLVELTSRFNLPLNILLSDRTESTFDSFKVGIFRGGTETDSAWNGILQSRSICLLCMYVASVSMTAASTKSARTHSRSAACFRSRSAWSLKSITKIKGIVALRNFHVRGAGLVLGLYF